MEETRDLVSRRTASEAREFAELALAPLEEGVFEYGVNQEARMVWHIRGEQFRVDYMPAEVEESRRLLMHNGEGIICAQPSDRWMCRAAKMRDDDLIFPPVMLANAARVALTDGLVDVTSVASVGEEPFDLSCFGVSLVEGATPPLDAADRVYIGRWCFDRGRGLLVSVETDDVALELLRVSNELPEAKDFRPPGEMVRTAWD